MAIDGRAIPIFNPALRKESCCGYGDWLALDMLVQLNAHHAKNGTIRQLTKTCPSCGATVTVDWDREVVIYTPRQHE